MLNFKGQHCWQNGGTLTKENMHWGRSTAAKVGMTKVYSSHQHVGICGRRLICCKRLVGDEKMSGEISKDDSYLTPLIHVWLSHWVYSFPQIAKIGAWVLVSLQVPLQDFYGRVRLVPLQGSCGIKHSAWLLPKGTFFWVFALELRSDSGAFANWNPPTSFHPLWNQKHMRPRFAASRVDDAQELTMFVWGDVGMG